MTTRPNAARLIAAYQRGEPLPRQLARDEIRELVEEAAELRLARAWGAELAGNECPTLDRAGLVAALRADLAAGMCPPSRTECAWCETKRGALRALNALEEADARILGGAYTVAALHEMRAELERKSTPVADDAAPSTIAEAWCLDPACSGSPCRNTSKPEPWVPKVGDVVNVWAGGEEARVITVDHGFIEVRFNDRRQERWPRDTVRPVREASR